ncbi:MAG TPA: SDR family oxidoreductase, partial [Chthoniobacterales bacterium]|nr:SDR family oxidoreductase [Chthoniobacterales bacterium]
MNTQKIALITGANKGIGLETARQLAQQKITVLIGARDPQKGEAAAAQLRADQLEARAIELDVSRPESIRRAAEKIDGEFGRLDILVNNAGVMLDEQGKQVSEPSLDIWRTTFETNFFGLIETTRAFLPLLRKSEAGRIVNLSSILGSMTLHATPGSPVYDSTLPVYGVSKTAVNAYTIHLAYELKNSKIKVNAAHPGWVKTEMGGAGATMEIVDGAKTSVALATIGEDGPNGAYMHRGETLP